MRNGKRNRRARTGRRDFWRSFPLGLLDLSDLPLKVPWAGVYLMGAVWIWGKRKAALGLLEIRGWAGLLSLLGSLIPSFRRFYLPIPCSCGLCLPGPPPLSRYNGQRGMGAAGSSTGFTPATWWPLRPEHAHG